MPSRKCKTKIVWNGRSVALLSWTEDMMAWSFSLPAGREGSCPMMVARDSGDICHGCYAQINRYNMPNVLKAQWARFLWTKDCLDKGSKVHEWIDTMIDAIDSHVKNGFFRVHDSGDLFSPAYIMAWYDVCRQLPHIRFWFPTRSWQATNIKWTGPMKLLASLPNVTVRPSAIRFDETSPIVEGLSAGTTVITDRRFRSVNDNICPKTTNGGTCESNQCRTCWSATQGVAYLVHGYRGRHKVPNAFSQKIQDTRHRIMLTVKGATV